MGKRVSAGWGPGFGVLLSRFTAGVLEVIMNAVDKQIGSQWGDSEQRQHACCGSQCEAAAVYLGHDEGYAGLPLPRWGLHGGPGGGLTGGSLWGSCSPWAPHTSPAHIHGSFSTIQTTGCTLEYHRHN